MAKIKIDYDVDNSKLQVFLKQLDAVEKELKKLKSELGAAEGATEEASGSMVDLAGAAGLANTRLGSLASGAASTAKGLSTAAKGVNILKIALIALPIFAIIAGFTALMSWFKRTEEGAQKLRVITAALSQVMDNIIDIAIKLGEQIFKAFSDPKKTVLELWETIKTNFVNRINGLTDVFKFFGKTIQSAFELDWEGVQENIKATGESLLQATSIDNLLNKIVDGFGKAKDAIDEWGKSTVDNVNKAIALQERENKLIVDKRKFLIREGELQEEINVTREKASDQLLTDKERVDALRLAQAAVNKLTDERLKLAREERDIAFARSNLAISDEATLERVAELDGEIVRLTAARASEQRRITAQLTGLEKKIRDDAVKAQIDTSNERVKIRQDELVTIAKIEGKMIELSASSSLDAQRQKIDLERGLAAEVFDLREKELQQQLTIQNLTVDQQKKINDEIFKLKQQRGEFEEKTLQKEVELQIQYANKAIELKKKQIDDEINAVKEASISGEITRKEANERILEIEKRANEELFEATKSSLLSLLETEELTAKQREEIEKRLTDAKIAFLDAAFEETETNFEKTIERLNELFSQFAGIIQDIGNFIFDAQKENIDRRLAVLEESHERDLEQTGDNADAKKVIEENYTEEKNKLLREQARVEKKQKIFSAVIGTAQAVIQALASAPPPASFILAALTGALGAAQIIKIASEPIGFAKGTKRVPGRDTGKDSVYSILRPGEGVMPVNRMNEYRPAFEAMFDHRIDPKLINDLAISGKPSTNYHKEIIRDSVHLNIDKHGFYINQRRNMSNFRKQVNRYKFA